jgi:hypothetical protein
VLRNMINDLLRQNATHIFSSLTHKRQHVSVLLNRVQANANYVDMVHIRIHLMHQVYIISIGLKLVHYNRNMSPFMY